MVLVNFSDLKKLIHDQFDHYLLNDLTPFKGKVFYRNRRTNDLQYGTRLFKRS